MEGLTLQLLALTLRHGKIHVHTTDSLVHEDGYFELLVSVGVRDGYITESTSGGTIGDRSKKHFKSLTPEILHETVMGTGNNKKSLLLSEDHSGTALPGSSCWMSPLKSTESVLITESGAGRVIIVRFGAHESAIALRSIKDELAKSGEVLDSLCFNVHIHHSSNETSPSGINIDKKKSINDETRFIIVSRHSALLIA